MNIKGRLDKLMLTLAVAVLFAGCAGSRNIRPNEVASEQEVKLFLNGGEIDEGIILQRDTDEILFVSMSNNEPRKIFISDIRNVNKSNKNFDYNANLISDAEIRKYRRNKNTWGYAVGGGIIGGLAGLAVGLPIWLANDNPPPLLAAGIGFVAGSIYYASRGVRRDHEAAVAKVRLLREEENSMEDRMHDEEAKLKALKEEKERLKQALDEKRKNETP